MTREGREERKRRREKTGKAYLMRGEKRQGQVRSRWEKGEKGGEKREQKQEYLENRRRNRKIRRPGRKGEGEEQEA